MTLPQKIRMVIGYSLLAGATLWAALVYETLGSKKTKSILDVNTTATSSLDACIDQYRWDTQSLKTARFVIETQFDRLSKAELARYVSDRKAIELVYCKN